MMSNPGKGGFTEHRTITVELWAVEGFDFESALADVESVLAAHSNEGADMTYETSREA